MSSINHTPMSGKINIKVWYIWAWFSSFFPPPSSYEASFRRVGKSNDHFHSSECCSNTSKLNKTIFSLNFPLNFLLFCCRYITTTLGSIVVSLTVPALRCCWRLSSVDTTLGCWRWVTTSPHFTSFPQGRTGSPQSRTAQTFALR